MNSNQRHPYFFDLLHLFERGVSAASTLPATPFFDRSHFKWADDLERSTERIRSEYRSLVVNQEPIPPFQEVSREQKTITNDDKWKTYIIYAYGAKSNRNASLCPETTRLVAAIPGMKTAFFSILAPGKEIPRHRGPYKGLIRCHLGIDVPEGDCGIDVAGITARWENGRCLFFDDTFQHRAWNRTNRERVVLFLDILRPLRGPLHSWNDHLIRAIATSRFGQRSIRRFQDWYADKGIVNDAEFPLTIGEPQVKR